MKTLLPFWVKISMIGLFLGVFMFKMPRGKFNKEIKCMNQKPLFVFLLLVILAMACGASAPTEVSVDTALPPTSIPTASETPTPVPTATANLTATIAAKATQASAGVLAELDDILKGEEIAYQEGSLLWEQETPLNIKMNGPDYRYTPFAEGKIGKNFILKSDVTWEATGILICGVMFRSEPDLEQGKQYQFLYLRFSGLPAWAIEFHEFGYFKNTPTKVQHSGAVDLSNGATNQLVIVVREEEFIIFINGIRQGRFFDYSKQSMEGGFAVLGNQDSGKGSCEFDNTFVWALK
jgi:hypothetical protein